MQEFLHPGQRRWAVFHWFTLLQSLSVPCKVKVAKEEQMGQITVHGTTGMSCRSSFVQQLRLRGKDKHFLKCINRELYKDVWLVDALRKLLRQVFKTFLEWITIASISHLFYCTSVSPPQYLLSGMSLVRAQAAPSGSSLWEVCPHPENQCFSARHIRSYRKPCQTTAHHGFHHQDSATKC